MDKNERDTHFQGFAKLVAQEIGHEVNAIGDFDVTYGTEEMYLEAISKIIAQRAYDLASFAVYKSMRGCSLAQIPDITEWSTLTENRKFDVD